MQEIIEQIKQAELKLGPNMEWHQISQAEANKMKNFNNGLKKAIEIITQYDNRINGFEEVREVDSSKALEDVPLFRPGQL